MSVKSQTLETGGLALGNREIERRIDQVGDSLIQGARSATGADETRPRFISTAELIRRVQPFLGRN